MSDRKRFGELPPATKDAPKTQAERLFTQPLRFETAHLLLHTSTSEDAKAMNEAIHVSANSLSKFLGRWASPPPSLEETRAFLLKCEEKRLQELGQHFVGYEKDTNAFAVSVGLNKKGPRFFEIGGWASEALQGKGYAVEALVTLRNFAFEQLLAERVETRSNPANIGSRKASLKAGFLDEGLGQRPNKDNPTIQIEESVFGLSRAQWLKLKG